jgi:hypothetical protein
MSNRLNSVCNDLQTGSEVRVLRSSARGVEVWEIFTLDAHDKIVFRS